MTTQTYAFCIVGWQDKIKILFSQFLSRSLYQRVTKIGIKDFLIGHCKASLTLLLTIYCSHLEIF